ncbi:MAG TPA: DNA-directed RNA polymerase subunit beta' [Lentisphaeria bacterium]|nr:MAG: DNA-directed RNA polymerase subunit beta' [Lentisphaerae bacterium GWF2_38_69]HBM15465.1 DNA-directed RNA polymerase subunit beta' [Lentisphaeria bacterium]
MIDTNTTNKGYEYVEDNSFEAVSISIASPERIRSWSHGEVRNPETINYRSFKPEKGGLFCERIFGPSRDWECSCGKYKRIKYKGVICDRCGVEVTVSRVRRERMGHIELAVPVSHVWFFKCMPSRLGLILDMTARALERVIYYEEWVVIDAGDTPLKVTQTLSEIEYREAIELYGSNSFVADMGAPAIKKLLETLDLKALKDDLGSQMFATRSRAIRKKIAKRLRLIEGFTESQAKPEWMILEVLPVIPPELRPLVPLEGGRFATYDLNDLYRRVIYRNNRLKNLLQLKTPEVIIRNEKRMLQEAVDALMDNGRHGRAITGAGNRPLKSLSDMLKGKGGRFRQNLLGKRVDYSGRSVIVVGPELKLDQCGLPKKMALTLFEPFIIRHLKDRGYVHTVRSAKKMIERGDDVVWDILEEVTKGHPVLLNRAPTLHRLSIQAFNPVLIEGSAIRIHPLVCTAYNADFDGDQMAVHIPLSGAAQLESKLLMLAPNNIFSPSNGKPIATPSQDITLGSYYLTTTMDSNTNPKIYGGYFELLAAYDEEIIKIHDLVKIPNPDYGKDTIWGDKKSKYIITTLGRCKFNEIWPVELGFFNQPTAKKTLNKLIGDCYIHVGHASTVKVLDALKALGYEYATRSGFSISIADLNVPKSKTAEIEKSQAEVDKIDKQYNKGVITEDERLNKIIDIWSKTSNTLADELINTLRQGTVKPGEINPVYAMLDSGARGSKDQIKQLAGMRGLMAKPSGEIIENPIISNFREGLKVQEYFISTHGARKGLADTALKTADSGYMTRKLVDVAQDIICREDDCGTSNGIVATALKDAGEEVVPLRDRIKGRYCAKDIPAKGRGKYYARANDYISEELAAIVEKGGVKEVTMRSPLTCEAEFGVCIKCYGKNLASNSLAITGDAVGIIAAQSIGEPGTQLTMRTFHIGGTASSSMQQSQIAIRASGTIHYGDNVRFIQDIEKAFKVVKAGSISIKDEENVTIEKYELPIGATIFFNEKDIVKEGDLVAKWDPFNIPILAEVTGRVEFRDLVDGITLNREVRASGIEEMTVLEHREDLHPQIVLINDDDEILDHHPLPSGAYLMVKEDEAIQVGSTIARLPRQLSKNKDITGGLPRVSELFEARRPKELAEIARMTGRVEIGKMGRGKIQLIIHDMEDPTLVEEHSIPSQKHLTVRKGDIVKKGQKLTDGSIDPHDLLEICGPQELQKYLVNEVQMVYRAQGVEINDKHIEIIVKQMLQKVRITEPGSTQYLPGEQIDKRNFIKENSKVVQNGGTPAEADPVLLGITKASLETESFISAASFQDTTRILTDAAILGKVDGLRGFKENVITGHLIPAGTGTTNYTELSVIKLGEEVELEFKSEEESQDKLTVEETVATAKAAEILAIDK